MRICTLLRLLLRQAQATLSMIEREADHQLARRRDTTVPEWVSTLTEESPAWQFLKPKTKPIKKKKRT